VLLLLLLLLLLLRRVSLIVLLVLMVLRRGVSICLVEGLPLPHVVFKRVSGRHCWQLWADAQRS